jgi:hypothetical protein
MQIRLVTSERVVGWNWMMVEVVGGCSRILWKVLRALVRGLGKNALVLLRLLGRLRRGVVDGGGKTLGWGFPSTRHFNLMGTTDEEARYRYRTSTPRSKPLHPSLVEPTLS